MPAFVALLRGVNVGGAKRVPMVEFRAVLSELGYSDIKTLLNSGNASFQARSGASAMHAERIAVAINLRLGFEVPVVVKSASELARIVRESTIVVEQAHHSRFLTVFIQKAAALADLSSLHAAIVPPEQFAVGESAAYLYCATGILESKAGRALLGKRNYDVTTRNWSTVLKLHALAIASDAPFQ